MADQKIQLILEAYDKTKDAFASMEKAVKDLSTGTTAASVSGTTALGRLKESWMGLSAAAVAAGVAITKAMQYINLGADALRAEEAFGAMAQSIGADAGKMAVAMKTASGGFVDDSHLMQKAAFAMAADIDPEKIPQLFEAARMAARLSGKDIVESIDGIIQAVSTGMPRALRLMQLITKEQMNLLNQAVAAGVTEIKLLDIVLANTALKSAMLGDSQDNAAKQIKRFKVEIDELKEAIGKGLIVFLQKAYGVMQGFAAGALYAAYGVMSLVTATERMGAKFMTAGPVKDKELRIAAEHAATAEALLGAADDLMAKGAANITGQASGSAKGPSSADAAEAKSNLQRLMDDLKKRIAAAKGGGEIEKLREEWAKIERELSADIAKTGLDEFEKKLADIDKKVEELKIKAAKLPTEKERQAAAGSVDKWALSMQDQAAGAEASDAFKTVLEGYKAQADAEKSLTETNASELQKRLNAVAETAKKQNDLVTQAMLAEVMTTQQAAAKSNEIDAAKLRQQTEIRTAYEKSIREAEINQQLAALDLAEKEGSAHRSTIDARIRLMDELKTIQEGYLASLDKSKDPTGWYAQATAIQTTKKALADLSREAAMQDPFGAMNLAMSDLVNKWSDVGQQMYDLATSTAQAMQQAFSDIFFDAFQGKLKSVGDYITSFVNSVNRAIANYLANMAAAGLIGALKNGISSYLGGGMNTGAPAHVGEGGTTAFGMHTGGMGYESPTFYRVVPSAVFLNAPRYHTGIGPGERAAIIRDEEGVFTPGQMAALGRNIKGSEAPVNIVVNIDNQSGTQIETEQKDIRFDHEQLIINVIAKKAKSSLGFRNMLASGGRGA